MAFLFELMINSARGTRDNPTGNIPDQKQLKLVFSNKLMSPTFFVLDYYINAYKILNFITSTFCFIHFDSRSFVHIYATGFENYVILLNEKVMP